MPETPATITFATYEQIIREMCGIPKKEAQKNG